MVTTAERYSHRDRVERALRKTKEYQTSKYAGLNLVTPDEKLNVLMNEWVKKQVNFCIVGKKGVRDNLQIAVAILNYRQERLRRKSSNACGISLRPGMPY